MCIGRINLSKLIEEKLKAYGLLEVKSIAHKKHQVYSAKLMSLPLIIQNMITIIVDARGYKVSSGAVFDSKDVDEKVVREVEIIMNKVTVGKRLTLRKAADSFWVEMGVDKADELEEAIEKVVEAIRELNRLFSQNESVREECLYKKMRQFPLF